MGLASENPNIDSRPLRKAVDSRDLPGDMKPSKWVRQVMRQARAEARAEAERNNKKKSNKSKR